MTMQNSKAGRIKICSDLKFACLLEGLCGRRWQQLNLKRGTLLMPILTVACITAKGALATVIQLCKGVEVLRLSC